MRKANARETVEELLSLGDGLIAVPKGYEALGAFDTEARSKALDEVETTGSPCQGGGTGSNPVGAARKSLPRGEAPPSGDRHTSPAWPDGANGHGGADTDSAAR